MKLKTKLVSIGAAAMMLVFSAAFAWDGSVTGTIQAIDVVGGASNVGNYDIRVSLSGGPLMCAGGVGWAYINATDPNYQVLAAILMSAKVSGGQVTVLTVRESGYCHIGYISMT